MIFRLYFLIFLILYVLGMLRTFGDFDIYIERSGLGALNPWICSICRTFSHKSKYNVQNHVESKHFPKSFVYNCKYCTKEFYQRNTLSSHESRCPEKHGSNPV